MNTHAMNTPLVPSLDVKNLPGHATFFPFTWESIGTPPGCMDKPYFESADGMRVLVVPIYWDTDRYAMSRALARAMIWCYEEHHICLTMCLGSVGIGLDLYRTDSV